jgi:hypothetical protein
MFAEDATESLCRYRDYGDASSEDNSSMSLNTGSHTPKQINSPIPEAEQALVLLHASLDSDSSDRKMTHQSMIRHDQTTESHNHIGTSASSFDDMEYYLQLSHGCNRMIEVQQLSCALARTVLDNPAPPLGRAHPKVHVQTSAVERESTTMDNAGPGSSSEQDFTTLPIKSHVKDRVQHLNSPLRHRDHLVHQVPHGRGIEQDNPPTALRDTPAVDSIDDGLLKFIPLLPKPLNDYMEMQVPNDDDENVIPREHAQSVSRKPQTSPSKNTTFTVPTPFIPAQEDNMFRGVGNLLLRKEKEIEGKHEEEREEDEITRFDMLEQLLIAQQEARTQKEAARKAATQAERQATAEIKIKEDEDKIGKLYQLMLTQKDEQMRREQARDAEMQARDAKWQAEKRAAAEKAKDLLDAAKVSREGAEKKAAVEKAELQRAHEQAKKEADEAHAEWKRAYEEQLIKAREAENERTNAPVKFEDAIGRKFSCPWHSCKTWKVHDPMVSVPFMLADCDREWRGSYSRSVLV